MNFAELIAPITEAEFFDRYFEREVLHVDRHGRSIFTALSNRIDVEQIIHLSCRTWGEVSLAKPRDSLGDAPDISRPPTVDTIWKAWRDGYTLVINDLQLRNLEVARLCRTIERRFFCRANVNLYQTPAESAGLDCHYDDDDVFVLQLRGNKAWRTWPHRDRLPLGTCSYSLDDLGEVECNFTLSPGDVLYMPRGTPHQAEAQTLDSVHLTISLNLLRWADLARELISDLAESEISLRRAVPPAVLHNGADWPAEQLFAHLTGALKRRGSAGALIKAQERLLAGPVRIPSRFAASTSEGLTAATQVEIVPDQIWCKSEDGAGAVMRAIGVRFEFPGHLAPVASFLAKHEQFTAEQMPIAIPLAQRLDVIRRLLDHGFLIRSTARPVT